MQKQSRTKSPKRIELEGLIVLIVLIALIIWLVSLLVSAIKENPEYHFMVENKAKTSNNCWVDTYGKAKCLLGREIICVDYYYTIN